MRPVPEDHDPVEERGWWHGRLVWGLEADELLNLASIRPLLTVPPGGWVDFTYSSPRPLMDEGRLGGLPPYRYPISVGTSSDPAPLVSVRGSVVSGLLAEDRFSRLVVAGIDGMAVIGRADELGLHVASVVLEIPHSSGRMKTVMYRGPNLMADHEVHAAVGRGRVKWVGLAHDSDGSVIGLGMDGRMSLARSEAFAVYGRPLLSYLMDAGFITEPRSAF